MISPVHKINDRMEWLFRLLTTEGVKLAQRTTEDYRVHLYLLENCFYEIHYRSDKHPLYVWELEAECMLDRYIDEEIERAAKQKKSEPVPLVCQFTGISFDPQNVYFEPYPDTVVLVCRNGEAIEYCGPSEELEVIMDYMVEQLDFVLDTPDDPRVTEMYCMLGREFPGLDWEEVFRKGIPDISNLITELPFVVALEDENEYDIPVENGKIYYFADSEGRESIRKELMKLKLILETCLEV